MPIAKDIAGHIVEPARLDLIPDKLPRIFSEPAPVVIGSVDPEAWRNGSQSDSKHFMVPRVI